MTGLKVKFLMAAFMSLVLLTACSSNILEDFADTDSTEAKIAAINDLIDARSFDAALTEFNTLSAADQAVRANQVLLAQIYAGQCGMDFLGLSEDITQIGTSTLMVALMAAFPGAVAADVTACINAEATILGIDTSGANRTTKENLLMAYIAWAKIGVILSQYADTDDTGTVDGAFDPCQVGDLPQTQAQHVATGIANMLDGLGNIGSSGVGSDQLTGINAVCTVIEGVDPNYNFCNSKQVTDVTAQQEQGIRSAILDATNIGLGANGCASDFGTPGCVCP